MPDLVVPAMQQSSSVSISLDGVPVNEDSRRAELGRLDSRRRFGAEITRIILKGLATRGIVPKSDEVISIISRAKDLVEEFDKAFPVPPEYFR